MFIKTANWPRRRLLLIGRLQQRPLVVGDVVPPQVVQNVVTQRVAAEHVDEIAVARHEGVTGAWQRVVERPRAHHAPRIVDGLEGGGVGVDRLRAAVAPVAVATDALAQRLQEDMYETLSLDIYIVGGAVVA